MGMHKTICLSLVFVGALLLSARPGPAQTPKDAANPLDRLAWAVGGKWIAEVKGTDDAPLMVEVTYGWASHKKAIKYVIVFKTKDKTIPQYEGWFYWHPGKKHLALLQIDRQGNVTESAVTIDGDKHKLENVLVRIDGTKQEQRGELLREGEDAFTFKAFVPKDGKWVEAVAFKYKRLRELRR
jgi:hypothetical protein